MIEDRRKIKGSETLETEERFKGTDEAERGEGAGRL